MAMGKSVPVYEFEFGEVAVWRDGCICLKAGSSPPHIDPVEMSDEQATALAETILRLVREKSRETP
jgi:hypothetical protein